MPPFWRQVGNAINTAEDIAMAAVTLEPVFAEAALAEARLATCHTCPHHLEGRCGDLVDEVDGSLIKGCGCFVQAKVWVDSASCPQGHW